MSSRYVRPAEFRDRAEEAFAFLTSHRFVALPEDEYRVAYASESHAVHVFYDARDGRVSTMVEASVGDRAAYASLECLYVEAGLGPAQRVRDIARTLHSLSVALESQRLALRELLPVLAGPEAPSLLLRCHGR